MSREIFDVVNERDEVIEQKSRPAILIMDEMGVPGEGTRPTRGRFCGGCRPRALTRQRG
jgi:hypothetical protein